MPHLKKSLRIKNFLWGELQYEYDKENFVCMDDQDPPAEQDRVLATANIHLSKKRKAKHFKMQLIANDDSGHEIIIDASVASHQDSQKKQEFIQFKTKHLYCKTDYTCKIFYKDEEFSIFKEKEKNILSKRSKKKNKLKKISLVVTTPPARQDPMPIKIAFGGDQECHQELGFIGKLLGFNNYNVTKKIYKHIGEQEEAYGVFIHLGDLSSGTSLSRHPGKADFKRNLKSDLLRPAKKNLAKIIGGSYAATDDHDGIKNGLKAPTTPAEETSRRDMGDVFNETLLAPNFPVQYNDGYGTVETPNGREGGYFKKRIGQHEIFILHNRLTQKENPLPNSAILGEAQWEWLEKSLEESLASNKILVSPLPLVMGKNPGEDYRAHAEEWHRLLQLCRNYKIKTILTADSHDFSQTEFYVREEPDDEPWIVNHILVGTLGGQPQSITDEEEKLISGIDNPPLLPKDPEFQQNKVHLYKYSRVISYFSPGSKRALLPVKDEDSGQVLRSEWVSDWKKYRYGYASLVFTPETKNLEVPSHDGDYQIAVSEPETQFSLPMSGVAQEAPQSSIWNAKLTFFACTKKEPVHEVPALAMAMGA